MKTGLLIAASLVLLVGCQSPLSEDARPGFNQRADIQTRFAEAEQARRKGQPEVAKAALGAIDQMQAPSREFYLDNLMFYERARAVTAKAIVHAENGEAPAASQEFLRALDILADGEGAFQRLVNKRNTSAATTNMMSAFFWLGISKFADARGLAVAPNLRAYAEALAQKPIQIVRTEATRVSSQIPDATDGQRFALIPSERRLGNAGRLLVRIGQSSHHCTAYLVGPRLALTNAHCVTNGDPQRYGDRLAAPIPAIPPSSISLAFWDFVFPDIVKVQRVVVQSTAGWDGTSEADFAVLFLDRHPTNRGFIGVADRLPPKVAVAGYSGDLNDGRQISVDWGCNAEEVRDLIYYRCRTFGGASGSSVLDATAGPNAMRLVGLHAFGRKDSTGNIKGGLPVRAFASAVARARSEVGFTGQLSDSSEDVPGGPWRGPIDRCSFAGLWAFQDGGTMTLKVVGDQAKGIFTAPFRGGVIYGDQWFDNEVTMTVQPDKRMASGRKLANMTPQGFEMQLGEDPRSFVARSTFISYVEYSGVKLFPGECE